MTDTETQTQSYREIHERLSVLWDEVLGAGSAACGADFFSLGGQSLATVRLVGRIALEFGVRLRTRDVFDHPLLSDLAHLVEAAAALPARADGAPRRERRRGGYSAPLAPGQERFWQIERAVPEAAFFNQIMRVDVVGEIDFELLMSALRGALRRHDVLRATFADGPRGPEQTVRPEFTVPIRRRDHGPVSEQERERLIGAAAKAEARLPFDLVREIPLRLRVLEFADAPRAVLVATHHIAFDGWSRRVLVQDVAALYRARVEGAGGPAPLALSYPDFASWQVERRAAGGFEQSAAYWRERLRPPYPDLRLPGAVQAEDGYRSASRPITLPGGLVAAVGELARRERTTVFTVLLTAVQLSVAARCGAREALAAIQVANRQWPGTQELVGPFANTLVLRNPINLSDGFLDQLRSVHAGLLQALDHQEIPLEHMVDELRARHGVDPAALLQLGFVLQDAWVPRVPVPGGFLRQGSGLAVGDAQELDPTTFGLTIELRPQDETLTGSATYKSDLYPPEAVDAVVAAFVRILELAAADPLVTLAALADAAAAC